MKLSREREREHCMTPSLAVLLVKKIKMHKREKKIDNLIIIKDWGEK